MNSMEGQPTTPGGEAPPPDPTAAADSADSAGQRIQAIIEAAEKAATGIIEDADAQARRYLEASRRRAEELADERVRVMSDLTDTLMRQADLVKRQSDELLSALDAARGELAGRIGQELSPGAAPPSLAGPESGPPQGPRVPHLQAVEEPPTLKAVAPAPQREQPPQPSAPEPGAPPATTAPEPPAAEHAVAPGSTPASTGPSSSDGARLLAAQMAVAGSSREEIEGRLRNEFGIEDAAPILDGILGPD
jgi:vacuolar-type H+-ATPase subunit H